uniref:Uncharacterized protein n=1 Tax=Morchella brunnea TaxID=1174671 RepID=A0A8K1I7K1_9PEZI|nr:hypothetical protein LK370_mgp235 [Morchella brunnea]UBU98353.1 hypothetical protein [Morchella brunnea]
MQILRLFRLIIDHYAPTLFLFPTEGSAPLPSYCKASPLSNPPPPYISLWKYMRGEGAEEGMQPLSISERERGAAREGGCLLPLLRAKREGREALLGLAFTLLWEIN